MSKPNWEEFISELEQAYAAERDEWGDVDDELIARYVAGTCTAEESHLIQTEVESHPRLRALINECSQPTSLRTNRRLVRRLTKMAVISAAGIMIAALILFTIRSSNEQRKLADTLKAIERMYSTDIKMYSTDIKKTRTDVATNKQQLEDLRKTMVAASDMTKANTRIHELETRLSDSYKKIEAISHLLSTTKQLPIGSVVMWWGDKKNLPEGWELCNGELVQAAGPLFGQLKPDITDRFPKGATHDRLSISDLASKGKGGNHNLPAHIHDVEFLKVEFSGDHTHNEVVTLGGQSVNGQLGDSRVLVQGKFDNAPTRRVDIGKTEINGFHDHKLTGFVGYRKEGDATRVISGDGRDESGSNQPAYSEIFFVIRTK